MFGDHVGTDTGQIKGRFANIKRKYDRGEEPRNHIWGNKTLAKGTEERSEKEVSKKNKNQEKSF